MKAPRCQSAGKELLVSVAATALTSTLGRLTTGAGGDPPAELPPPAPHAASPISAAVAANKRPFG
jgi:hypothetical protein